MSEKLKSETVKQFLKEFNEDPESFLEPAPVNNPIRKARLERGISQEALAEAEDLPQEDLSKNKREWREPDPLIVEKAFITLENLSKEK